MLEDEDALAELTGPVEATVDEDDDADSEDEEDDRPDLLLRESARIVGDMVELGRNESALARQFSLLNKEQGSESLH